MPFSEKVVVVTGAGQGIGYAVAAMYAARGARVCIAEKTGNWGNGLRQKSAMPEETSFFSKWMLALLPILFG